MRSSKQTTKIMSTAASYCSQVSEAIINKQRPNFDAGVLTQLSRPFLSGELNGLVV